MSKFLTLMNPHRRRRRSRRLFGAALAAHQRKVGRRTHRSRRRVRRNPAVAVRTARRRRHGPPAMTPAMRAKISRAVKASIRARASRPRSLSIFRRRSHAVSHSSPRRRRFSRSLGSFTGSIKSAFTKDLVLKASGAVVASFGTGFLLQKYGASLPFSTNKYGRIAYSVGIPLALAYLLRRRSRPLAEGMVIGGLVMGINAIVSMVRPAGVAAVSAMIPQTAVSDMGVAGELGFSYYPPAPRSIGVPLNTGAFSNSPW